MSEPDDLPNLKDLDYAKMIRMERDFLHDISSPLMVAMGMLEAATESEEMDKMKEKAQKAGKALARMTQMVKNHRKILVHLNTQVDENS